MKNQSNDKTVLILGAYQHAKWWSIYRSIALQYLSEGFNVEYLDISRLNFPSWQTAYSRIANLIPHLPKLRRELVLHGVGYRQLHRVRSKVLSPIPEHLIYNLHSQLGSYMRDDKPMGKNLFSKKIVRSIQEQSANLIRELESLHFSYKFDTVVIPNGRMYLQALAADFFRRSFPQVQLRFCEVGLPGQGYFLESFPIHDREETQNRALELASGVSKTHLITQAKNWLAPRMKARGGTNPFSATFDAHSSEAFRDRNYNLFFTTSTDEFWSLGPKWEGDEWSDQYEAFYALASHFASKGELCVFRVHPNLSNKSFSHFRREVLKLKLLEQIENVEVVWHHEGANSYDLVSHAKRVIVSRSMLGFESQLLGKPVWVTSRTNYDMTAHVRTVFRIADITDANLKVFTPDPLGSAIHINGLICRDRPYNGGEGFFRDFKIHGTQVKLSYFPGELSLLHLLHLILFSLRKPIQFVYLRFIRRFK